MPESGTLFYNRDDMHVNVVKCISDTFSVSTSMTSPKNTLVVFYRSSCVVQYMFFCHLLRAVGDTLKTNMQ